MSATFAGRMLRPSGPGPRARLPGAAAVWLSLLVTFAAGMAGFAVTTSTTNGWLAWSDGLAYFLYARSVVVDGNTDLTNEYEEMERRDPAVSDAGSGLLDSLRVNARRDPETGRIHTPWPPGAGVTLAPFYAAGYLAERGLAALQQRQPDSYGIVPQFFFGAGSLVLGLAGFWATFLCCRELVRPAHAYVAALGAILGGPAVFYIFANPTMAHAASFGLAALLLRLWWTQWHGAADAARFALLGLLLGLLVTIRLQNAVFALLPAVLLLRELARSGAARPALLALAGALAGALPLGLHALHVAHYGAPSEGLRWLPGGVLMIGEYPFDLSSPFLLDALFSCRHGAFHWAPLLALGTAGVAWAAVREGWARVFLLVLVAQAYLIGALGIVGSEIGPAGFDPAGWETHWKGGTSFGMRYLTECTPLFAAGLAVLLRSVRARSVLVPIAALLVVWNGLLILAYGLGTVSRTDCVTYPEMASGVARMAGRLKDFTS